MRGHVGRVQLCGDGQVLDRFFEISALLESLFPTHNDREILWILLTICPKRVDDPFVLALPRERRPHYSTEGTGSSQRQSEEG